MRCPHHPGSPIGKGHDHIANACQVGLGLDEFSGVGWGLEILHNYRGREESSSKEPQSALPRPRQGLNSTGRLNPALQAHT